MCKDSRALLLLLQSQDVLQEDGLGQSNWAHSQPACCPGPRVGQVLLAISDTLSQSFIATSPRLGRKTSPYFHFCCWPSCLKEPMPFPEILCPTLRVRFPFLVLSGGITAPLLFHHCKLDSSAPRNIEAPKLYL